MRYALLILALLAAPATAKDLAGRYRLAEGPDVGGALVLNKDGKFGYELAAGALDERATGTWEMKEGRACLTTVPTPKAPEFQVVPAPKDQTATVSVTWAPGKDGGGRGVAGVDFVIGTDKGEPITDYTQEYGWTLRPGERRVPRWIELKEPIYRTTLARTAFPASGKFHAVLVPNDIGVVNFQGACLEQTKDGYLLRRPDGQLKFRSAKD